MSYNVLENVANSNEAVLKADYVLAFCGTTMYIVKSRGPEHEISTPPHKPDYVMAYYAYPEPHIESIPLRQTCPTCSRRYCRCQEEIEEVRYLNDPAVEYGI